jgi:LacI family transcriptional regulator
MATIHDVARRAGVSATTVSHVINSTRPVSSDLRDRVLLAMDELGFQPNALARSLRRKQSHTIGLVVPDTTNPFFAEMARGIEDAAYTAGHTVILCNSDGDTEREALYLELLLKRQVDGIVLVSASESVEVTRSISERALPIVVVDRELPGVALDCVFTDQVAGGRLATSHLLALGHRNIGCITGPAALAPSEGRVQGYVAALKAAGRAVDDRLIAHGDFHDRSGYTSGLRLLALDNRPTAIFASNDMMAIGAMAAAREFGLTVPGDISIVGYDDIGLAEYMNPPLTTVAQPKYELGRVSAQLLLERTLDRSLPPRRVLLRSSLVVRGSTSAPRSSAPVQDTSQASA